MKVLSLNKIKELVNLVRTDVLPQESNYFLELQGTQTTYQVPEYSFGKSFIEVYKNGFRLCEGKHYNVSQTGGITLLQAEHNPGDELHIIHKRYK